MIASLDGGNSWTRHVNPFATLPTESLVLERGSGVTYLYAGSSLFDVGCEKVIGVDR